MEIWDSVSSLDQQQFQMQPCPCHLFCQALNQNIWNSRLQHNNTTGVICAKSDKATNPTRCRYQPLQWIAKGLFTFSENEQGKPTAVDSMYFIYSCIAPFNRSKSTLWKRILHILRVNCLTTANDSKYQGNCFYVFICLLGRVRTLLYLVHCLYWFAGVWRVGEGEVQLYIRW